MDDATPDATEPKRTGQIFVSAAATATAAIPDVSASLTTANQTALTRILNAATPVGTTPNAAFSANGANFAPTVAGALNVAVVTAPAVGSNVPVPAGYTVGYITGGDATLTYTGVHNGLLVGTSASDTLVFAGFAGYANTVIGGNGNNTIVVNTDGASTLPNIVLGGTGKNTIIVDGETAVTSIGTDTILGASVAGRETTITSSAAASYYGRAGTALYTVASGSPTLSSFTGTVNVQAGSPLVFNTRSLNFTAGTGASTIVGSGPTTITGGAGNTLAFTSANTVYTGGAGIDTIVGTGSLTGSINATVGINGTLIFGGQDFPGDRILAMTGAATYIGGSSGTSITLGGAANHLIGLNTGNIAATASTGSDTFFLGAGSVTLNGGSGATAIVAGAGNATLTPGSGDTLMIISAAVSTSRTLTITNFDGAHDFVNLQGFAAGAGKAAYAAATVSGINTSLTLTDGTHIVFQNPTHLASFSFT